PGLLASVFVKNCTYENSRGRGCSSHRIVGAAPSPAIIAGAQRGARRVNATCHHPLSSKCFFSTDGRVEPGRDKSRTAKALVSELTNCPSVDGATTCIRSPAHGQKCRNHRGLAAMPEICRTSHFRRIRHAKHEARALDRGRCHAPRCCPCPPSPAFVFRRPSCPRAALSRQFAAHRVGSQKPLPAVPQRGRLPAPC